MIAFLPLLFSPLILGGILLFASVADLSKSGPWWGNVVGLILGVGLLVIGPTLFVVSANAHLATRQQSAAQCQCRCLDAEAVQEIKETP